MFGPMSFVIYGQPKRQLYLYRYSISKHCENIYAYIQQVSNQYMLLSRIHERTQILIKINLLQNGQHYEILLAKSR